ncbi:MAG: hypothetical protein GXY36_11190 [Chloroflexi bacterium]|nr:hypothetical protein [Chloroflexota bacterium]
MPWLVVLVISFGGAVSAQNGGWEVTSAAPVSLPEDAELLHHLFYAPDGLHVVYEADGEIEDRAICRTAIMTGAATCVDVSREFPRGRLIPELYFSPLGWSPDSTKVAVVDQAYRYYRDSDLWVIDFEAGTTANLTDDDYDDNLMPGNTQPGVAIETQPTWSPDGSQIAVERMVIDEDGGLGLATLSLVDAVTGEVRDLGRLPSPPDYEMDAGSVLDLAWSPDGTQLAFTLRHMRLEPEYDGIWLMDVASGQIRQLLTVGQAVELMKSYTGEAEAENLFLAAAPLVWSPDGSRLLFWAGDPTSFAPGIIGAFVLDLETGEVTSVPLPDMIGDLPDWRQAWPVQAAWSPDSAYLLVSYRLISSVEGEEPLPLIESEETLEVSLRLVEVATGESRLLGYLPLIPMADYQAIWAPTGDVVIDGHHLEMSQG